MFTLFLILVERKGNKKERHDNDHLELSYSQSSFPKLLVTKPELVAHHPGRERQTGKKREWKRGKRREKLCTRREQKNVGGQTDLGSHPASGTYELMYLVGWLIFLNPDFGTHQIG